MLPVTVIAKPLDVAVWLDADPHAQSMAPGAPAAKAAFATKGCRTIVFPCASGGKPAPAAELDVTVIAPVAPSIATEATYLDMLVVLALSALKDVAKLGSPQKTENKAR